MELVEENGVSRLFDREGQGEDSLIPTPDTGSSSQCLCDTNSLLLTTTHASNGRIADRRLPRVPKPKHRSQNTRQGLLELLSGILRSCSGGPRARSKLNRLLNGKSREMHVIFGAVLDVSSEMLGDFLGGEGVVVSRAGDGVVPGRMVGDGLEEGAASCSWASKYN